MTDKNNDNSLKHILFADGVVGLEITTFLLSHYPNDVVGVVTTCRNEIFDLASRSRKPCFVFDPHATFVDSLPGSVDFGILAWWPHIIKSPLLELPRLGFINTHPSLLPHNRGKNPNFWAIVEERPFGVTIHKIDKGVDSGPIIAQRELSYDWTDTGGSIYKRGLLEMVALFKSIYPGIRINAFDEIPQNKDDGSFHLSNELDSASRVQLDGLYSGRQLLNLLRARIFDDYPACYFSDNGEEYEVRISITKKEAK